MVIGLKETPNKNDMQIKEEGHLIYVNRYDCSKHTLQVCFTKETTAILIEKTEGCTAIGDMDDIRKTENMLSMARKAEGTGYAFLILPVAMIPKENMVSILNRLAKNPVFGKDVYEAYMSNTLEQLEI